MRNYAKHMKTRAILFFDDLPPTVKDPEDWALYAVPPGGMGPFTKLVGECPDQRLCRLAVERLGDTLLRRRAESYLVYGGPKLTDDERVRLSSAVH